MAERIRDVTLKLYTEAARFAATKGIIIADTKFEFGLDDDGTLYLMDEVLTPDSRASGRPTATAASARRRSTSSSCATGSRPRPGTDAAGPRLPQGCAGKDRRQYREALDRLMA